MKGEQVDGHQFVSELLKKNNVKAIVDQSYQGTGDSLIKVPSTQEAHWLVAHEFRKKFKGKVIGVGGSNGKTSTKEFLFALLKSKFNCIKTIASQNGLLGLPKTLESLRSGVEIAVVEIGTDAPGDMKKNVPLVDPDIGILTSIGPEHLNLLKNLEGVFKEERFLSDYLENKKAPCYVPQGDKFLQQLVSENKHTVVVSVMEEISKLKDQWPAHQQQNLSLAMAIAKQEFGLSLEELKETILGLSPPAGRGQINQNNYGSYLIEDHYNSNPASLEKSIDFAVAFAAEKKMPLCLVLGDMLDLGETSVSAHQDILDKLSHINYQAVVFIGPIFQSIVKTKNTPTFINSMKASEKILELIPQPAVILFKGSNGMVLGNCLEKFKS